MLAQVSLTSNQKEILASIGEKQRLFNADNQYIFNMFNKVRSIFNRSKFVMSSFDSALTKIIKVSLQRPVFWTIAKQSSYHDSDARVTSFLDGKK